MKSISKHIDGYDVAADIRLDRKTHKGAFLLVEGITDIKRFNKFIDETRCRLVNCFNKSNVIEAIDLLYDEGFQGVVGLADADFDRITLSLYEHEGIIYSEAHDFDSDFFDVSLLNLLMTEYGDPERCRLAGGAKGVFDTVHERVKALSVIRLAALKASVRCRHLRLEECLEVEPVTASQILERFNENHRKMIEGQALSLASQNLDHKQLNNGHDLHAALGYLFRNKIASRREAHTWAGEIASQLRLVCDVNFFRTTSVFRQLTEWEKDHGIGTFKVLSA